MIKYPDYENCIAGIPNSILKSMGIEPGRRTSELLDRYLAEKAYENIVVILLDGMGKNIIDANLSGRGFFNSHMSGTLSSTFPPTTVAATTSILSGMEPCEHGWLGWDCYYPQIDKNVTVFLNKVTGTDEPAAAAAAIGAEPRPDSFEKIVDRIEELCGRPGRKYIYSYWNEPDHTMHEKGCFGEDAKSLLKKLEKQVRQLCMRLDNNRTLIIVTADHGHIDTKGVALTDYPKICECLLRLPSIEPRALNFFIKPGMEEQFVNEFNRKFSDNFMLLTKEEVLKNKLFGEGSEHAAFRDMLGDYLAVATGALCIYNTREEADFFIGAHAGLTEEEMTIPLILVEC